MKLMQFHLEYKMNAVTISAQPPDFLKLLAHDLRWKLVTALSRGDHRVYELVQMLDQPMNLVSYHLKQLREQQLVTERRSSADGRDVYYSLDLDLLRTRYFAAGKALHPSLATIDDTPQAQPDTNAQPARRVLFLCTHNSARSQMAEGILRHFGGSRVAAFSAGSEPAPVHPDAVQTLAAMGIDISQQQSKHLDEFANHSFDYIITVCDRVCEACPVFPDDPERIHWSFADPAVIEDTDERAYAFRQTAQQLVTRVRYLLTLIERDSDR
jgi:ArsR family transcriptional regulator, arsenate/arsenite/antimonite-responsive transcriptional repressor / arsenate reductase (thioredoxin)